VTDWGGTLTELIASESSAELDLSIPLKKVRLHFGEHRNPRYLTTGVTPHVVESVFNRLVAGESDLLIAFHALYFRVRGNIFKGDFIVAPGMR
jgi:hypothetical protein